VDKWKSKTEYRGGAKYGETEIMRFKNKYSFEENVEVYEIKIKQDEYEERIVRLIKALLEIDRALNQQEDHGQDLKEAA